MTIIIMTRRTVYRRSHALAQELYIHGRGMAAPTPQQTTDEQSVLILNSPPECSEKQLPGLGEGQELVQQQSGGQLPRTWTQVSLPDYSDVP